LDPGDRIRIDSGGAAMTLADEVTLEAQAGSERSPSTDLRMGTTPVLEEGPLLIEAENGASVGVGADGEVVEIGRRAGVRIERGTAVEVGVYRGEATITSAGRDREVGALRAAD